MGFPWDIPSRCTAILHTVTPLLSAHRSTTPVRGIPRRVCPLTWPHPNRTNTVGYLAPLPTYRRSLGIRPFPDAVMSARRVACLQYDPDVPDLVDALRSWEYYLGVVDFAFLPVGHSAATLGTSVSSRVCE